MTFVLKIFLLLILFIQIFLIIKTTKKRNLATKYSILWLLMVFGMILVVIFPNILFYISNILGFETTSNMIFLLAFFFCFYMLFIHTTSISKQKYQIVNLIQEISLLKKQINDDEKTFYESDKIEENKVELSKKK